MVYYLSRENKKIADLISEKLRGKESGTRKIRTSTPRRLENIIRSACQLSEYKWIGERYVIKVKSGELWFVERVLAFEFDELPPEIVEEEVEFFDILNILLLQDKFRVDFSKAMLDQQQVEQLQEWGVKNNYEIKYENEILKVRKNG